VLHGSDFFYAKAAQKMMSDLAFLPAWYAGDDDYVLVDSPENIPDFFLPTAKILPRKDLEALPVSHLFVSPWGLTLQCLQMFEKMRAKSKPDLVLPAWNDNYPELLSRKSSANCLEIIRQIMKDESIPAAPQFFSDIYNLKDFIEKNEENYILKAPFSSSGRGLRWIPKGRKLSQADENWIRGVFNKQKTVSVEQALDKKADFALEFFSNGRGKVEYHGLSLFTTNDRGAYTGNVLASQKFLEEYVENLTGNDRFQLVRNAVAEALQVVYAGSYTGYLGVDMLVYREKGKNLIHPCVEVNLRHTMGLLALHLSEKYICEHARASLHIIYVKAAAMDFHIQMKEKHPAEFIDGKLSKGYLSLCPVAENTQYLAYILIR
jgi:hypothetical protein